MLSAVRGLLPREDTKVTPLRQLILSLEAVLYSKQAVLGALVGSGVIGAASIISELVKQTHALRGAGASAPSVGPAAPTGHVATSGGLSEALEAAFSAGPFVQFRAAMQQSDLLSTAGRRQAFEAATEGDCLLAVRLLVAGEPSLARRDEALGTLMNLRPFLAEWFTYVAAVDSSGNPHPGLTKWSIAGAGNAKTGFIDQFLKQEFHAMNWIGAHDVPGLYHLQSERDFNPLAAPHPADHYCVPRTVRELGSFGQSLFSGLGYPAHPRPPPTGGPAGFSWQSWWELVAQVLEKATSISHRGAQLDWLDDVHQQAEAALVLMSRISKAEIFASEGIKDHKLNAVLPFDCAPAEYLRTKVREFDEDMVRERRRNPFGSGRGGGGQPTLRAHAHEIPLRSWRQRKRKLEPPLGPGGKGGDGTPLIPDEEGPPTGGAALPDLVGGEDARPRKTVCWLTPKSLLFVSGRVWDVRRLSAKLGVTIDSKCWEVLLSRRTPENRLRECPRGCKGFDHAALDSAAHTIAGFAAAEYATDFSRLASDAEKKKLVAAAVRVGTPKGGGRGAAGRVSGRQGFRPPAVA